MLSLLGLTDDGGRDISTIGVVEMAFPAQGRGDRLDFLFNNATAGNKRGYVSPKVKRVACETMATLADDTTLQQYEDVHLKGPEKAGIDTTRKFIPEIVEI